MTSIEPSSKSYRNGRPISALIVDDEIALVDVLTAVLCRNDYRTLSATSAAEALAIWLDPAAQVDILILDSGCAGFHGRELVTELTEHRPEVPVLLMSGSPKAETLSANLRTLFLQKPFSVPEFLRAITDLLEKTMSDKTVPLPLSDGTQKSDADVYERIVMNWLGTRPEAVTPEEIYKQFEKFGISGLVIDSILGSLQDKHRIGHGPPRGFLTTWQIVRKVRE
ncbi:MAG: sensor hybrid histidine kinase [Candidatus Sulfotelmatobacter sp.]|nr:sensor hybrid histidine kinase [Candidatus Sulfotelmatobacter sp.]